MMKIKPYLPFVAILFIGFFLSAFAAFYIFEKNESSIVNNFQHDSKAIISSMGQALNAGKVILLSTRSFFRGSKYVETDEFKEFISPLTNEIPGLLSIGFAEQIRLNSTENGKSGYEYPIVFHEPCIDLDVEKLTGLNVYDLIEESSDIGGDGMFLSSNTLRNISKEISYVILLPIGRNPEINDGVTSRKNGKQSGYICGFFNVDSLIEKAISNIAHSGISVFIESSGKTPVLLSGDRTLFNKLMKNKNSYLYHFKKDLKFLNADLRLHIFLIKVSDTERLLPVLMVFLAGCVTTFVLFLYFIRIQFSNDKLERQFRELSQAESEVRFLKQRIEFVLGATNTGLDILDSDFNMVYVDPGWAAVYGNYEGKKCFEYFMNRDAECPNCAARTAFLEKRTVITEETLPLEGNRPIQVISMPFQDEQGKWLLAEVNIDITERKKMEQELQASEEKYRVLFNDAPQGILVANQDGSKFVMANKAMSQLSGYSENELMSLGVKDLHPEEYLEKVLLSFKAIANGRISSIDNIPLKRKDSKIVWVNINGADIFINEQKCIIGFFTDVSAKLKADQELIRHREHLEDIVKERTSKLEDLNITLRKSKEMLRLVIDNIPQRIFWKDRKSVFEGCNMNFAKDAGFNDPNELTGKTDHDLPWTKEESDFFRAVDKRVMDNDKAEYHILEPIHPSNGGQSWLDTNKIPLKDPEGNVIGILCSYEDITPRKQADIVLSKTLQELKRSNAELEQFAYVASHDLQEPLRMIGSYVQLLNSRYKKRLDADADRFISYTVEGVQRMQNLIRDLLAYSRVSSSRNRFRTVDLKISCKKAADYLSKPIEDYKVSMEINDMPAIKADPAQIEQMFLNLFSNAIKFRSKEPLKIAISSSYKDGYWTISVADNGIGIDRKYAEKIFLIFNRLHSRDEYPGTGIGLAICKRIAHFHGGDIWVESEPGKGSTFFFSIKEQKNDA